MFNASKICKLSHKKFWICPSFQSRKWYSGSSDYIRGSCLIFRILYHSFLLFHRFDFNLYTSINVSIYSFFHSILPVDTTIQQPLTVENVLIHRMNELCGMIYVEYLMHVHTLDSTRLPFDLPTAHGN